MEERINFMSYNGLRKKKLDELPKDFFDDALVIIDEVHNVIRNVINGSSIMSALYEKLLLARNSKFVLLSATPIINKPSEVSYIINLIQGYNDIFSVNFSLKDKHTLVELEEKLNKIPYIDFYDLYPSTSRIDIKLNPYGFHTNTDKGKGIQYVKKTNSDKILTH